MNKKLLATLIIIPSLSQADIGDNVLNSYKSRIFVNTGIGASENFSRAIHAGFPIILSIDKNEILVNHFKDVAARKVDYHNTKKTLQSYEVYHLKSHLELNTVINKYNERITFLLGSIIPEYQEEYNHDSNILMELEHIRNHAVKNHIILIDYIHHAGSESFHFITLDQIKEKLLDINSRYTFKYEQGGYLGRETNAVLVAYLS